MGRKANLCSFLINSVEDRLIRGLGEATGQSFFLIFLVSIAKTLRAKVECVAEGLVDAVQVTTSHEDLGRDAMSVHDRIKAII